MNEPSQPPAGYETPGEQPPPPETAREAASREADDAVPDSLHRTWLARAYRYRDDLEQRPRIGFLVRSSRRFGEIEGRHLALVIAVNLFISVIPLLILGYAFLVAFDPERDFGAVAVRTFHLTGSTARLVESTFTNARSGRTTALSISLISLLITGLDVSATVQLAYARAFEVAPLSGLKKHLRGASWLVVLLTVTGGSLAVRYFASGRPWWFLALMVCCYALLQFGFFLVTPRLLLDLPFAWRDLVPGAMISTVAAATVAAVSSWQLHSWLRAYGQAYGAYGISLSIIAYVSLLALFWVWVAVVMGTYWARGVGSSGVAAMQDLASDTSRTESASP